MTAVIYARYSTDSQREESIEGQIRECTAYAEKNGSPAELYARKGLYTHMVDLQSASQNWTI